MILKSRIKAPLLGLFLCLAFSPAYGDEGMTLEEYTYVILAVDYLQTRDIITNGNYYEVNPVIGKYPSMTRLNVISIGYLFLHRYMQDTQYQRGWNITMAISHTAAVAHNYKIGVKIKF